MTPLTTERKKSNREQGPEKGLSSSLPFSWRPVSITSMLGETIGTRHEGAIDSATAAAVPLAGQMDKSVSAAAAAGTGRI